MCVCAWYRGVGACAATRLRRPTGTLSSGADTVVATTCTDPHDERYPPSSLADLDPGPDLSESLNEADLVASDEHRVVQEHQRHAGTDDEDRFDDADDIDDAESGR